MKIAIIGASGQLGYDISNAFSKNSIPLSHEDIEIKNSKNCMDVFRLAKCDVIINCAAYTRVDDSEDFPEESFAINTIGAKNIALVCDELNITNVFISTDYVFNGEKNIPYTEEDRPNPVNIYGLSKYAGEVVTKNYCSKYYIIRLASIYGSRGGSGKGGNFVKWMIEKAKSGEPLNVVDDLVMSPTYTVDAAETIKSIIKRGLPYGVYHVTNQGHCSWFEFSKEIFKILDTNSKVIPIKSQELNRKAKRPKFSALQSTKLNRFGIEMRYWDDALRDYLINHESKLNP